ncbi:MAG TPA: hypothetical protein PK122_00040 [Candidatus Paceibacterota bacterium]|nr:hypothetical protein [Candidatus Paceibacterota bacterium]
MAMYNKSKFRFSETFNNSNTGKTSGSGFIGVIMGLVATLGFLTVLVGWWIGKPEAIEIFDKVLQLGLLSAALLGVRKFSGALINSKGDKTGVSGDNGEEGEGEVEERPESEKG